MNVRHSYQRRTGFTLVELLVVLGVIALLTGIVVPTVLSRRNQTTTAMRTSARELYALLAAAKVYAATHNVPTAVVYGLTEKMDDSHWGTTIQVIDSVAVVRGFKTPEEVKALKRDVTPLSGPLDSYFQPIAHEDGSFNRLSNNVVLLPLVFDDNRWVFDDDTLFITEKDTGFVPVRLARSEEIAGAEIGATKYIEISPLSKYPYEDDSPDNIVFPAHVFLPSGIMKKPLGGSERFKLHVGPRPDDSEEVRFEKTAGALDYGQPKYVQIFLYPSTGRVAVAESEPRVETP
jgi:prepilin-type N-terminal cleavage/methylation domain-containing protein